MKLTLKIIKELLNNLDTENGTKISNTKAIQEWVDKHFSEVALVKENERLRKAVTDLRVSILEEVMRDCEEDQDMLEYFRPILQRIHDLLATNKV